MKKKTQSIITNMLRLLNRKQAHFFQDKTDGKLYYTFIRGGWMHEPSIDGKQLEYIAAHDDGGDALNKILSPPLPLNTPFRIPPRGKPVLGKISDLL